jgi:predicted AlkP superfamily phosphohydrolase/phosphomutase
MSRLVLIGIDGMDWPVLETMIGGLPAIRAIGERGFAGQMDSIFPPDSIPSWVSIFTGLDPSEHGILESIDYFKKDVRQFAVDTSSFRERTFWDIAGSLGKRVLVVNPLLAYPPWQVNGVMASGPVFISGETKITPDEMAADLSVPDLGGIVGFPEKDQLAAFARNTKEETRAIVDFTIDLMKKTTWDLAFVTLLTLDRIFHFFWRYFDRDDPTHPQGSEHESIIREFHDYLDSCVEKIREAAGEDAIIMIISDHGHGRRPPSHFNINQLLLEAGFLTSRISGPKYLSPRYLVERAKNTTLEILHRLDMEDLAYRIAHILPWTRKLKKGDHLTEKSSNVATASDFGGSNPFGGISISRENCERDGLEYEGVRDRIIELLLSTKDEPGEAVFMWAKRREEVYNGVNIDKYPDVLYEMKPEYGTNWSLHLPLVTVNPRHRKISGGHRKNGVLIAGPLDGWRIKQENISPLNISSTILNILTDGGFSAEEAGDRWNPFIEKD